MSTKKLSVIFAGTPDFAVPALEKINLAGYEIKLVLWNFNFELFPTNHPAEVKDLGGEKLL